MASAGLQNGDSIILTEMSLAEVLNLQQVTPMVSTSVPPANIPIPSASSKDVISVPTENGFVVLRVLN